MSSIMYFVHQDYGISFLSIFYLCFQRKKCLHDDVMLTFNIILVYGIVPFTVQSCYFISGL